MLDFTKLPALYEAKGYTQTSFAKQMGCTQGYLSGVVNGKKRVNLPWLERLAEQLDLTLSGLTAKLEREITRIA